jgi:hypothetical protein
MQQERFPYVGAMRIDTAVSCARPAFMTPAPAQQAKAHEPPGALYHAAMTPRPAGCGDQSPLALMIGHHFSISAL